MMLDETQHHSNFSFPLIKAINFVLTKQCPICRKEKNVMNKKGNWLLMTCCHHVIFYVILSHFGVHKAT